MDTKQLKSLIKLLRSQGVTEYSSEGITLKLDLKSSSRAYKSVTEVSKELGKPQYSEDETLFWSSGQVTEDQQS